MLGKPTKARIKLAQASRKKDGGNSGSYIDKFLNILVD